MEWAIMVGLLASTLAGAIAFRAMQRVEQKRKKLAPRLEDRINSLTENLKSSLTVISEIETEIQKRGEIVQRLKKDAQRYEKLKELNEAQVEAITQTIRGEISGESKKSIRRNALITFAVAIGFFFLGRYTGAG